MQRTVDRRAILKDTISLGALIVGGILVTVSAGFMWGGTAAAFTAGILLIIIAVLVGAAT